MAPLSRQTNGLPCAVAAQAGNSLCLKAFQYQHGGTPWHLSMAAGVMFSLPLIVLFLATRKMFVKGIAMTGIKG